MLDTALHRGMTIINNTRKYRVEDDWMCMFISETILLHHDSPFWSQSEHKDGRSLYRQIEKLYYWWWSSCRANLYRSHVEAGVKCGVLHQRNKQTFRNRGTCLLTGLEKDWMRWILGERQVSCSNKLMAKEDNTQFVINGLWLLRHEQTHLLKTTCTAQMAWNCQVKWIPSKS